MKNKGLILIGFASMFFTSIHASKHSNELASQKSILDTSLMSIVFGVYCGECSSHCATMFQYNMFGNANTLLVDSTDSFFHKNGKISFDNSIESRQKHELARSILSKIPNELLITSEPENTFGCPDCHDGCGIYFELKKENMATRKFYIDNQTRNLKDANIKLFAEFIKDIIKKLKN